MADQQATGEVLSENLNVNKLESQSEILWESKYSTVFKCKWNEKLVAVKRIKLVDIMNSEEEANKFLRETCHENIVRLYHHTETEIYKFYTLELCDSSLDQAYLDDNDPRKYCGPLPPKEEILLQLAKGMKYIHDHGLVYLKAKPRNVLIYASADSASDVLMKWADFGLNDWLSYTLNDEYMWLDPKFVESSFSDVMLYGNKNRLCKIGSTEGDVYSEGLVFHYVLLIDTYPEIFCAREDRFSHGRLITSYIEKIQPSCYRPLIKEMLKDSQNRITSAKVVDMIESMRKTVKMGDGFYIDYSNILAIGRYGPVFYGTWKGKPVAIKQIKSFKQETEGLIRSLSHKNVVKLLHILEEFNNDQLLTKYYALEMCNASLDHFFLDDDNPKKFRGPMPSKETLFLGLSQGMEYIHSKNLIFDEISPRNVLILVDRHAWRENHHAKWSISGLLLDKQFARNQTIQLSETEAFWKAPELLTTGRFEQPETQKSNTFAVGLVFAYILLGGRHLYDSGDHLVISNIKNNRPLNLYKIEMEHFRKLINAMVSHDCKDRPSFEKIISLINSYADYKEIGENDVIKVYKNVKLGEGGFGVVLYGTLTLKTNQQVYSVAVKRIDVTHSVSNTREEAALKELRHANVIRLFHATSDENFRYFALELCQASMDQLFLKDDDPRKYRRPTPHIKKDVLCQLADGLEHIHSKQLIHRDIKPHNALIWVGYDETSASEKVIMKWADFGLCKRVSKAGTYTAKTTIQGTMCWMAPEVQDGYMERGTIKSDVFGEGLVFAYFLLDGQHPCGSRPLEIMFNISKGNIVHIKDIVNEGVRDLISKMLAEDPQQRINSTQVVEQLRTVFYLECENKKEIQLLPTTGNGTTATENLRIPKYVIVQSTVIVAMAVLVGLVYYKYKQ